jgi:hypothetical protein
MRASLKVVSSVLVCFAAAVEAFAPPTTRSASNLSPTQAPMCASSHQSPDWNAIRVKATAAVATAGFAWTLVSSPAFADGQTKEFKFPPIDYGDQNRCTLSSSSMGQANAARDKLYDLRECKIPGVKAVGYDLSGVSKCECFLCSTRKERNTLT